MKYLKLIIIGIIISLTACTDDDDFYTNPQVTGGEVDDIPPEDEEMETTDFQMYVTGGEVDDIPPED